MIKYNPNQWITLVFHRYSRKTFKKTLPNMATIIFYSTAFILLYEFYWKENLNISPIVHSLLGIVLGLFLVFRTNTAYDKWWEGRKVWGALVNDSRNLALKLNAFIPAENVEVRKKISNLIHSYAVVMKEHLRDNASATQTTLSDEQKQKAGKRLHLPNFIASEIYETITGLNREKILSDAQLYLVDKETKGLTDHVGACERIKNTPIPYSYSMYIKKFIFIYTVTLPLALASTFGYWTIAVVAFVFYFLLTIELIAEEIEEPFGLDDNDLPTDELSEKIGSNVREILLAHS